MPDTQTLSTDTLNDSSKADDFWWRISRDSLFTKPGLQLFSIAAAHDGEEFDTSKDQIDRDYAIATGKEPSQRHGGKFQTAITVYEEAGWLFREKIEGKVLLKLTDKGL